MERIQVKDISKTIVEIVMGDTTYLITKSKHNKGITINKSDFEDGSDLVLYPRTSNVVEIE